MDGNAELCAFAERLESATVRTIEEGVMTKDLVGLFHNPEVTVRAVNTKEFLLAVRDRME